MRYSTTGGDGGRRRGRGGRASKARGRRATRPGCSDQDRMSPANAVVRAGGSQYNSPDADRVSDRGHRLRGRLTSHARSSGRAGRFACSRATHGASIRRSFSGQPIEVVAGDLDDRPSLSRAVAGVEAIVHVAGLTKARTLDEYRDVNVGGTERLLEAAQARCAGGALRARLEPGRGGPVDGWPARRHGDPARPISWYGLSKREGEQVVERSWRGPWTVLRPGVVYGPGDRGLFVYFKMASTGWVPVPAGRARIQVIGAERAALAVARAASAPASGGTDPVPVRPGPGLGRRARLRDRRGFGPPGANDPRAGSRRAGPRGGRNAWWKRSPGGPGRSTPTRPGSSWPATGSATPAPSSGSSRPAAPGSAGRGPGRRLGLVPGGRMAPGRPRGRDFVKFAKIRALIRQTGTRQGETMSKVARAVQTGDGRDGSGSSKSATGTRTRRASVRPATTPSSA